MARKPIGRPKVAVPAASIKAMETLGRRIAKHRAATETLADETDAAVARFYADGVPITQIAQHLGLTSKTIRACLNREDAITE